MLPELEHRFRLTALGKAKDFARPTSQLIRGSKFPYLIHHDAVLRRGDSHYQPVRRLHGARIA